MNIRQKQHRLDFLPIAFYLPDGKINSKLINDCVQIYGISTRKLKLLIGSEKGDDRSIDLANKLEDPDFRRKWYEDCHARRKNNVTSFFYMVFRYTEKCSKVLGWDNPQLKSTFTQVDGKRYPKLDAIDTLAEHLCSERASPLESALFTWALIESCNFHSLHATGIHRDLLTKFPKLLMASLEGKASDHFLPLLEINKKPEEKKTKNKPNFNVFDGDTSSDREEAPQLSHVFHKVEQAISATKQERTKFAKLASNAATIIAQVNSFTATLEHCEKLLLTSESLVTASQSVARSCEQLGASFVSAYSNIISDWTIAQPTIPVFLALNDERWILTAESELAQLRTLGKNIYALSQLNSASIEAEARTQLKNAKFENIAGLNIYLFDLLSDSRLRLAKENTIAGVREKIFDNAQNWDWDASKENKINSDEWHAVSDLVCKENQFSTLCVLLERHTFESSSTNFAKKILYRLEESNRESIFDLVCAVAQLDYEQVEQLYLNCPEIEVVVALAQLQNFCVESNFDNANSFRWWSRAPLSRFAKPLDDAVPYIPLNRFFTAIYNEATTDGINIFKTLANLSNEFDYKNIESGDFWERDQNELITLLAYRPHGAGTYAALWRLAHQSIFEPLAEALNQQKIESAVPFIVQSLQATDVDDLYRTWLKNLSSHAAQESQYEKVTKVYVNSRISQILSWCNGWALKTSVLPKKNTPLSIAVEVILKRNNVESKYIADWLEAIKRISSAANETPVFALPSSNKPGKLSPLMPRSYIKELAGDSPAWSVVFTDELINFFAPPTALDLLAKYREERNFEALENLCLQQAESLSKEEISATDAEIELEALKYAVRLSDLKTSILESKPSTSDVALLEECQNFFARRRWNKLISALALLELAADDSKKRKERDKNEIRFRHEITVLQGRCDDQLNYDQLVAEHSRLLILAEKRKTHLKPIEKILTTSGIGANIHDLSLQVIAHLSRLENLPAEQVSEFYAEVWGGILTPTIEQLRRPALLVPNYRSALERLVIWLLKNIQAEPAVPGIDSPFAEACMLIGERLGNIDSANDIDKIISDYSDSGQLIAAELPSIEDLSFNNDQPLVVKDVIEIIESNSPIHELDEKSLNSMIIQLSGWLANLGLGNEEIGSREERNLCIKNRQWQRGLRLSLPVIEGDDDRLASAVVCAFSIYSPPSGIVAAGLAFLAMKGNLTSLALVKTMRPEAGPFANWFHALFSNLLGQMKEERDDADRRFLLAAVIRQLSEIDRLSEKVSEISSIVNENLTTFDLAVAADGSLIRALWEEFSGEKTQAEVRGRLLIVFWRLRLFNCLAECLRLAPIDLDPRLAKGYVRLVKESGEGLSAEAIENLRRASSAKAYAIFADKIVSELARSVGLPAVIRWAGPLERTAEKSRWRGMLEVVPRLINPPLDITIRFGNSSFLALSGGRDRFVIHGPFFEAQTLELHLDVRLPDLQRFDLEVECAFTTVDGSTVTSSFAVDTELSDMPEFKGATSDQIDDAFASFPSRHMRGIEFVERPNDEERIEKILFSGNDAGSLWLASPRRSGKTSMLFRILDAYSHSAGRDNVILYFTFDRHFESVEKFNQWLWSTLRSGKDNEAVRRSIEGLTRLGENLPFTAGANDFIQAVSDLIRNKIPNINRVYFLFDEVDRLAEMQLAEGNLGKVVMQLMWQLRHVLSSSAEIGFLFAGSSLARKFFVEASGAAFYNSIPRLELTPFNCASEEEENISRRIVSPTRLKGQYKLPSPSLNHLLDITAGIPYYMKLVAGATYSVSRQSTILPTDVNRGLQSIFGKDTGITRIDSLDNPGEDELRTLYANSETERTLAKAVLFSMAELRSPLDFRAVRIGELRGDKSPLVSRYRISRENIDRGIAICTDLGYLRRINGFEIEFTIPILGESIRHRNSVLWSGIEDKLELLSK